MAWSPTSPADTDTIPQGAQKIRDNNDAIEVVCTAYRLINGIPIEDGFPGGNTFPIWVYLDTAPTGWTYESSIEDQLIAVKGGSEAYNVAGGLADKGSWTQPDHTLTTDEIPSHDHILNYSIGSATGGNLDRIDFVGTTAQERHVTNTGGGAAHNHGDTYRPQAAVGIIISKD